MSRIRVYAFLAGAMAVATTACVQRVTRESGGDVAVEAGMAGEAWGAALRGYDSWPALRGSAFAHLMTEGTRISLTIEGGFPGSNHGWDVREGACGARGPVVGDSAAYAVVFLGEEGRGDRVANIGVRLDAAKAYSINIYSSGVDPTIVAACSALTR